MGCSHCCSSAIPSDNSSPLPTVCCQGRDSGTTPRTSHPPLRPKDTGAHAPGDILRERCVNLLRRLARGNPAQPSLPPQCDCTHTALPATPKGSLAGRRALTPPPNLCGRPPPPSLLCDETAEHIPHHRREELHVGQRRARHQLVHHIPADRHTKLLLSTTTRLAAACVARRSHW